MSILMNCLLAQAEDHGLLDVAKQVLEKGTTVGYVQRVVSGRMYAAMWTAEDGKSVYVAITQAAADIEAAIENDRKAALEILDAQTKEAIAKARELGRKAEVQ